MTAQRQEAEGAGAGERTSRLAKVVLAIAGIVAIAIGGAVLLVPAAFHEGYGIDYAGDASLLSETRAAGGSLLANGGLILGGAFLPRTVVAASALGAATYLSYGISRAIGFAVDGAPASGLVVAALVEVTIGLGCALVLLQHRRARRR